MHSRRDFASIIILTKDIISCTTIRNFLGITPAKAQQIFDSVKGAEIELYKFGSREKAVPTDLFLKLRGLNYDLVRERYKEKKMWLESHKNMEI